MSKSSAEATAESLAQVVAKIGERDVTRGELRLAFDSVADRVNWKNPIDARVDLDAYTLALVNEAVVFFTGSVPKFQALTGSTTGGIAKYRVTAVGYYKAVGA